MHISFSRSYPTPTRLVSSNHHHVAARFRVLVPISLHTFTNQKKIKRRKQMSMNHYISSDNNVPEAAQRWSQQHMMDSSSASVISSSYHHHHHHNDPNTINLNHHVTTEEDNEAALTMELEVPKEPLFQKPLTPSDVGKLNRLVIPKQHAEKYFPLNGDSGDHKGLLLSFEDEVGKCWRFRYSYWNSSQSYVLTKGWSRFVKEKKLDAGDVVLFLRHRVDGGRMFIGWRRKDVAQPPFVAGGWRSDVYYPHHQGGSSNTVYSNNDYNPHAGSLAPNSSTPVNNGKYSNNSSKRLRLFGVNLECQTEDSDLSEPSTPVGSPMSTSHGQVQAHLQPYHQYFNYYSNSNNFTLRTLPDI